MGQEKNTQGGVGSFNAAEVLDRLKAALGACADRELAEIFEVTPNALTNWRGRNRIPQPRLMRVFLANPTLCRCSLFDPAARTPSCRICCGDQKTAIPYAEGLVETAMAWAELKRENRETVLRIVRELCEALSETQCEETREVCHEMRSDLS